MADKINYVFERTEKKYQIQQDTLDKFLAAIGPYVQKDKYGEYTICNVYYDTASDELIRHSLEKPVYKEKMRLRSYGTPKPDDKVFLEIKKKFKGVVYKRRISLPYEAAMRYLEHGEKPDMDSQILREIDYFIRFYQPKPKLYLAYDRIAFSGIEKKDLRITVDQRIRSRRERIALDAGDDGELLLEEGQYLVEIKTVDAFPLWLTEILAELEMFPTSFSKYGKIYHKNLAEDRRKETCSIVS